MNFNANRTGARRPARTAVCLLCGALLCGMLTGCRSSRPQDGTYTARYQYPSQGYVEYMTVTFRDGRAAEVEFDAYSETDPGTKKSSLTKEEYPMDPHPSEWMDKLEDNIKAAGLKADKIAGVAGATSSSRHARELYDAILTAARDGKIETILVENEEEGPDSGVTADSGGTENSGGNTAGTENEAVPGADSGTDDGTGTDSGTIPGGNSGDNSDPANSGSVSDGNGITGDGSDGENPGKENASGGNGTGTGEDNSGSTGTAGNAGGSGAAGSSGSTAASGNTGTVGTANGSAAP